jgi:hypothetical protein
MACKILTVSTAIALAVMLSSSSSSAKKSDGRLKGQIVFLGKVSAPKKITATTDTSICGIQDLVEEDLLVDDKTKGIRSVVVWVPGSKRTKSKKPHILLDNYRCRYEPHVLILHTDQKLKIRNRDRFLHTTQALLGRKSKFNLALPTRNQVTKKRLSKPGFYSIHCDVHDWMKAWVAVFKEEVTGLTDVSGEFELKGLPTGKQKLNLWHETLGTKTIEVTIKKKQTEALRIEW